MTTQNTQTYNNLILKTKSWPFTST